MRILSSPPLNPISHVDVFFHGASLLEIECPCDVISVTCLCFSRDYVGVGKGRTSPRKEGKDEVSSTPSLLRLLLRLPRSLLMPHTQYYSTAFPASRPGLSLASCAPSLTEAPGSDLFYF